MHEIKTMNCDTIKPLISEFLDERLAAADAWQVQTHLSECTACGEVRRDLDALRRTLQALPTRQPSANFDAALAQRLALTRRPAARRTWRDRLGLSSLRLPAPLLRPALALGVAFAVGGGILLLPTHPPFSDPALTATHTAIHTADHAFVADCVAQHRRDAAGEPLADLAAQNLAGHLDNTAPGEPVPVPLSDTEVF